MKQIEELTNKITSIQSSIETTESLLAQILDKQREQLKKEVKKTPNSRADEKEINNLLIQVEGVVKSGNKNVLETLKRFKRHFENLLLSKPQSSKNVTIFGGGNAVVKYHHILLGTGIVLIIYIGLKFIPNYLIEKEQQDKEFLLYKTYTEIHQLQEFYNNRTTQDFDKLIESINNQTPEFRSNYEKLIDYWNREHEKANLKEQIEQNQQRLKELEK